jgi:acylphosphatase/dsDNA-specific endonuclease/ATPase MutS2
MNVMQRLTAYVSGKVQKTGYRARVVTIAQNLGLRGYVQNLDNGLVKVVAEGETADLEALLMAIDIKNTLINVTDVRKEFTPAIGDFDSFFKAVSGGETDQRIDAAAHLLTKLIVVNEKILDAITANNNELKETHEDIRGLREEVSGSREEIRGLREEVSGSREEIRGLREEVSGSREEIRGLREEMSGSREEIRGLREEMSGSREEIRGLREEVSGSREDIRSSRDAIVGEIRASRDAIIEEVKTSNEVIAGEIGETRDAIVGEIGELRVDLKDSIQDRLMRIESDVAQIKAKVGL